MTAQVAVGLDGTVESLAALPWAATEAVLREVPLRLVQVEEWPNTPEVPLPYARDVAERAESLSRDAADRARKDHIGLEVLTERARGRANEELTAAANEADLTVLGSRGLGGVRGFIVGSVSLAVVGAYRPRGHPPQPRAGRRRPLDVSGRRVDPSGRRAARSGLLGGPGRCAGAPGGVATRSST
ncbi:universal stress protein [Streptomyces sp. NPDC042898]|uniref:universal stress protein n=1 Tax=Streptomyces sp. NPDC042898 TaxID=3154334 RepID=UPI0033EFEA0A